MSRKRIIGRCAIEGCQRPLKSKGLCQYHYVKKRLEEKPERAKAGVNGHPFYHLWFERKKNGVLCEEWLDFKTFAEGISPKPEGEFFLVRPNEGLFSPINFKWEEHLRKRPDESRSEWWARKLANRLLVNPSLESDRNIKRQYGLTREQYNEKLKYQNFVCAICEKPETATDGRSNTIRKLAVDHCHTTDKIRGLLCYRCNTTIGRLKENLDLLDKMKTYLIKHST